MPSPTKSCPPSFRQLGSYWVAMDSFHYCVLKYVNSLPPALRNVTTNNNDEASMKISKYHLHNLLREHAHKVMSPYISPANREVPIYSPSTAVHHYTPTIHHYNKPPSGPVLPAGLFPHPAGSSQDVATGHRINYQD